MVNQTAELSVINTRRSGLMERVERRYRRRRYKKQQQRAARRGISGPIFWLFRVSAVLAVLVVGGSYAFRFYEQPDGLSDLSGREPMQRADGVQGTHREVEPKTQGEKTYKLSPAFTENQVTWERADSMIRPARGFLTSLESLQKTIPPLQAYLQSAQNDGIFGESQFRQGSRYRLVMMWNDRKDYRFPISKNDLETLSDKFEAAVERMKQGTALDEDAGTVIKTYEIAGKLLDLPLEEGRYLNPNLPTGPGAVLADLKRIKEEIFGPD